ncbi:MAG: DUF305 domain-containing protein [Jiangellaceae bacterium]
MTAKQGAVALLGVLLLAGCSADTDEDAPRVVQLASPGQPNRILTEDEVEALDEPKYTDADVEFVQGMIHHHAQALVMTAMVADRTASDDIPLMAERMDISQRDEISQLERWLEDRGEEVPDMSAHHDHSSAAAELMPGMLTDDELAQMEATTGPDFDLLFLQYMIRHHEGARIMVADLLTGGGGQEPNIFQLAQHIDSDQSIEIARMNDVLAELAPSPTP